MICRPKMIVSSPVLHSFEVIFFSEGSSEEAGDLKSACSTISGPAAGAACVFPFTLQNQTYNLNRKAYDIENITFNACAFEHDEIGIPSKPYCLTRTDANKDIEATEGGDWGFCDPSCPVQGSIMLC